MTALQYISSRWPSGPRRRAAGFSLTELLFAIFIMGVALAMSAALFPTAMRQAQSSMDDSIGTIICQNSITVAKMMLRAEDVTNADLEEVKTFRVGGTDRELAPLLRYLEGRDGTNIRGGIVLARQIGGASFDMHELVVVAYSHPDDGGNDVEVVQVSGLITADGEFEADDDADAALLRRGSPLIITSGTHAGQFARIMTIDREERTATLSRQLPAGVVDAWVIRNPEDDVFSPAMAIMAVRTSLTRRQP